MAKRALCVGINLYPPNSQTQRNIDLKGAVNDANKWAGLLNDHFDFSNSDIKILLNQEATKSNLISALKAMLTGVSSDDTLVYFFSGHGTYLKKEAEGQLGYDQAQCTYDWEEDLLIDKELRDLFLNLPLGIKLSVISDSCHSGSVTRLGRDEVGNPRPFSSGNQVDPLMPQDGLQLHKHIPPAWFGGEELTELEFESARKGSESELSGQSLTDMPEEDMHDVLLSGCDQLEFSWDAPFPGGHHGALTFYAVNAIQRANYQISYTALHKQVRKWMRKYKFKQTPQLEGREENKARLIFV